MYNLYFIFADPVQWSELHVVQWLHWAIQEFSLEGVNMDKFAMNGQELCKMDKEEFLKLAPPFMGDILWEHIDILQKGKGDNFYLILNKNENNPQVLSECYVRQGQITCSV